MPQPQMAEGHTVSPDGRLWTFRLRGGLTFHHGEPVLARDIVASLERFMKRISFGQTILERLDRMEAPDDKTVHIRLKKPLSVLLHILAKATPCMMPADIARASMDKPTSVAIWSGPFRFVKQDYVAGGSAAYEKFDRYVPRNEVASYGAGGHVALLDRIEWHAIPDQSTLTSALLAGEVDWADSIVSEVVPALVASGRVKADRLNSYGNLAYMHLNSAHGPTAVPAIRRALLAAIDQEEVMKIAIGDRNLWNAPVGTFALGTPCSSTAGMESLGTPRRPAKDIKAMLAAAGYGGEPLVNLHVSDHPTYDAISQVVVRRLREVGLTVRDEIMDHNTFYKRRYSKEPLDKGGWSTWSTATSALLYFSDPVMSGLMRGNGSGSLPLNLMLEESRTRWMELADEAGRNAICRDHQAEMLRSMHIVPLGQYSYYGAWRNNVSGVKRSPLPLFWGISKS